MSLDKVIKLRNRLQALPQFAELAAVHQLEEDKELLADYNRAQLYAGKTVEGNEIKPDYTPFTKRIKASKGQVNTRVTLKDTGAHHKSIKANPDSSGVKFTATDPKVPKLKKKYSKSGQLYGMSAEDIKEYNQTRMRPGLFTRITRFLF